MDVPYPTTYPICMEWIVSFYENSLGIDGFSDLSALNSTVCFPDLLRQHNEKVSSLLGNLQNVARALFKKTILSMLITYHLLLPRSGHKVFIPYHSHLDYKIQYFSGLLLH